MPLHTHFELLNFDTLAFQTRLCKIFPGAGDMSTVSKHTMPRYFRVARQLAENSAYPARFARKARSLSNSTKGRDSTLGDLVYGKQTRAFASASLLLCNADAPYAIGTALMN